MIAGVVERVVEREIELTIDSIAAGGEGVGRKDGIVVFVPRTAPGDRIRARIERRKRFARGTIEAIIEPSRARVEARCPHYAVDRCGGCQLQHVSYAAQLAAKRVIIGDALSRIGRRHIERPPQVDPSHLEWRYRSKLTLAMRRHGTSWVIGLRHFDNPDAVFQLDDCLITDERVMAAWREIMAASHLLPEAESLRGSVQLVTGSGAATAVVEGGERWPEAENLFRVVPSIHALWWRPEDRARALIAERRSSAAGASFRQVNAAVAKHMFGYVLSLVAAHGPSTVVDAYAGVGEGAVAIAATGPRVTAIEVDREAAMRCALHLPDGSRCLTGRVEDLLDRVLPA
ncbi:MAG TPA: TRAM domain-containing protein, partial [Gemmatimonadaceae bacterium]|nr:TRAM domain-containing protein [Gemmatimonadaceae bacterium]